ncbi:MAG: hypothetical protein GY757_39970, partial [bacterium]|nr:hypothetical protein [bacterium]
YAGIRRFLPRQELPTIRFFSPGEPTIEYDLLKNISSYAASVVGDRLQIDIQTNGIFNEKVANWISDNATLVWFSLDGIEEEHDAFRRMPSGEGSFANVLKNIKILLGRRPVIGIRSTVTKRTVKKQRELIDFASGLGLQWIHVRRVISFNQPEIVPDEDTFVQAVADAVLYGRKKGVDYLPFNMSNFDEPVPYACRACAPRPNLTPDGFVTACDGVEHGRPPAILKHMVFGRYDPEKDEVCIDREAIEKLRQRRPENLNACRGCNLIRFCAGSCSVMGITATGDALGIEASECRITKSLGELF